MINKICLDCPSRDVKSLVIESLGVLIRHDLACLHSQVFANLFSTEDLPITPYLTSTPFPHKIQQSGWSVQRMAATGLLVNHNHYPLNLNHEFAGGQGRLSGTSLLLLRVSRWYHIVHNAGYLDWVLWALCLLPGLGWSLSLLF